MEHRQAVRLSDFGAEDFGIVHMIRSEAYRIPKSQGRIRPHGRGLFRYHATDAERAVRVRNVRAGGCDGNEECEYVSPPLTTIVLPVEEMCKCVWDLLLRRLAGEDLARQHIRLGSSIRPAA
jgi:hypothetical protein